MMLGLGFMAILKKGTLGCSNAFTGVNGLNTRLIIRFLLAFIQLIIQLMLECFKEKEKEEITKSIEELNQQPPESQPHTLPLLCRNMFAVVNINNHSSLPPCHATKLFFFFYISSVPRMIYLCQNGNLPDGHLPEGCWCF